MDSSYTPIATVEFRFEAKPPEGALVALLEHHGGDVAALDDEVRWPLTDCELYRPFAGTGTIFVDHQRGWTKVYASWASDVDDVLLAVAITSELAHRAGAPSVVQEGYGPIVADDLTRLYDRTWAEARVAWAMLTAADRAVQGSTPYVLYGPNRAFELGRHTLARLDASDEAGFPSRLLQAMRWLQWPSSRIADLFVNDPTPPGVNSTGESVGVLRRGATGSIIRSDAVVLLLEDGDTGPPRLIRMSMDELLRRVGGHVRPVDEGHVFVEAIDGPAWRALLDPPAAPAPRPPAPAPTSPPTARRTGDCWVWIVVRDVTYLAFEFFEAGRGMKARGDRVSSPPTAAEVQAAVERPSHTFPTDAGMFDVRDLSLDEQIDLGLPVAPPWAE
jgi:hypothetical protein